MGIVAACAAMVGHSAAQDRPQIALPSNPSAVVLELQDFGGWSGGPPGPIITIHADRSIRVSALGPTGVHGVLTPADLQELLQFVIEGQGFFSFDTEACYVPLPPESRRLTIIVDHAPIMLLTIQTRDRQHSVRCDFRRRSVSGRFAALDKKLRCLAEEVEGGGKHWVAEVLRFANDRVALEQSAWPLFSIDDTWETRSVGRGRAYRFYRAEGETWKQVEVFYFDGQPPDVRITSGVVDADLLDYLRQLARSRGLLEQ